MSILGPSKIEHHSIMAVDVFSASVLGMQLYRF